MLLNSVSVLKVNIFYVEHLDLAIVPITSQNDILALLDLLNNVHATARELFNGLLDCFWLFFALTLEDHDAIFTGGHHFLLVSFANDYKLPMILLLVLSIFWEFVPCDLLCDIVLLDFDQEALSPRVVSDYVGEYVVTVDEYFRDHPLEVRLLPD